MLVAMFVTSRISLRCAKATCSSSSVVFTLDVGSSDDHQFPLMSTTSKSGLKVFQSPSEAIGGSIVRWSTNEASRAI